ncbi:MAG TPA: GNAT family N-acetyltransferase [Bacteroidia bacterium]|jgi:L-amino acid N-acyltransferase YncA|nr:GNAT family N-acetyltransferase [Bacteroidia bacterium]
MENVDIRPAKEHDLHGILEIYNDAIVNTTSVYNYKPHTIEMRKKWFAEKQAAKHPVFVATIDDKVVGFVSYGHFRVWAAYKYSVEHSVYVHPDFRQRGIAKKLLSIIIDAARQNDVHAIIAGIDSDNVSSIKLHNQFHFKEVGHFKQVGYKFGKWLDLIFMELLLDTPKNPQEN